MQSVKNRDGEEPAIVVAIDNVCAWPNLTLMPDGAVVATIHNQPSHLRTPGGIDCWASEDGGRTWAKRGTPAPRDSVKAARGHVAAGLARNGDLIVLTTGWSDPASQDRGAITPTWISRSSDGARTWQIDRDSFPAGPEGAPVVPFGDIVAGEDGNLRAATYWSSRTYIYRGTDDGRSWGEPALLPEPGTNETALLHLGGGRWLAAARCDVGKEPQERGGLKLYASGDDGRTWSYKLRVTGENQHPGHLTRLKDGAVLLTYGNRQEPRGVDVRFSSDEGQTWSEAFRVARFEGDGGYPSSVQLPDGQVLTAYYAKAVEGHEGYHMGVVHWDPDKTRGK